MPPVARMTDLHTCPLSDGPKPHVGGPITGPSVPTVLIASMPAAVVGDMAACAGPPDSVVKGSTTVLIGGRPAVRIGDATAHGGVVVSGCPTVTIDDRPVAGGSESSASGGSSAEPGEVDSLALALLAAGSEAELIQESAQTAALREAAQEGVATVQLCPLGSS